MVSAIPAITSALGALAEDTAALVERLRRSVVVVRDGRGAGSGVIWTPDGTIITNNHVTPGQTAEVTLDGGRSIAAVVRQSDPEHDLAVLEVAATGLLAATIGDSDLLRTGELVFAVGNPLGLPGAVSAGIITAVPRGGAGGMIRADVSLAPGN